MNADNYDGRGSLPARVNAPFSSVPLGYARPPVRTIYVYAHPR